MAKREGREARVARRIEVRILIVREGVVGMGLGRDRCGLVEFG